MNPKGEYKGETYSNGWNIDGWPASQMKTFIDNDIYNSLPNELKSVIITTETVSGHGSEDTNNFTSSDNLYLLAPKEIYSDWSDRFDTARDKTRQLDYYNSKGVTTNSYAAAIKKDSAETSARWWLRCYNSSSNNYFYYMYDGMCFNTGSASNTFGVSPAFRIG